MIDWLKLGVAKLKTKKYTAEMRKIDASGFFDRDFYLSNNPDVKAAERDPLEHYVTRGFLEGRQPSAAFNVKKYLRNNPDVAEGFLNPVLHWIDYGQKEGRINPFGDDADFDPFNPIYPPVVASQIDVETIDSELILQLSGLFDSDYYLEQNPDLAAAGLDPVQHYLEHGYKEGRNPSAIFNSAKYLSENVDVRVSGANPLRHWVLYGSKEKRPSPINRRNIEEVRLSDLCSISDQELTPSIHDEGFSVSILTATYNTPPKFLYELHQTIKNQQYSVLEWVIVDDGSSSLATINTLKLMAASDKKIKLSLNIENLGISGATNAALRLASGMYVALVDHDDLLPRAALLRVYETWKANKSGLIFYTDECKVDDDGKVFDLSYKPGRSPLLIENTMYIGHLTIYSAQFIRDLGAFRSEYDGTQDYDLALRAFGVTDKIYHVPTIGYVWRATAGSTALALSEKSYAVDRQRNAVLEYARKKVPGATVEPGFSAGYWSVVYPPPSRQRKLSFIIPTAAGFRNIRGNNVDLLLNCLSSLENTAAYPDYEVIIVHNGNLSKKQQRFLGVRSYIKLVLYSERTLNLSRKINAGVEASTGDILCLMNDDVEFITPEIGSYFVSFMEANPKVGIVGPLCLYENGLVQHNGIVMLSQGPSHYGINKSPQYGGMNNILRCRREVVGVTGAVSFVSRKLFDYVGGYSERLPLNYNDVDFCLRASSAGYSSVVDPGIKVYHYESASKVGTFKCETETFFSLNPGTVDLYFNKSLLQTSPYLEEVNEFAQGSKSSAVEAQGPDSFEQWLNIKIGERIRSLVPKGRPLLSVCVSVYNQPSSLLQELLFSFKMQTYPHKELVIINNGSTNASTLAWLAREDVKETATIVSFSENQGIMGANRALLAASTGDYLLPVDADDFMTIDALQVIAFYIGENPKAKLFYSDEFKSDESSRKFSPFFKPDFDPILFSNCCYPAHLMSFNRDYLIEIGAYADDRGTWSHDYDTITRAMAHGDEPVHIPELLYAWRIIQGSTASADTGTKPGTVASQQFALDRLLTFKGLKGLLEFASNNLSTNSGMWHLKSLEPLQSVCRLPVLSFLDFDHSETFHVLNKAVRSGMQWVAFSADEGFYNLLIQHFSAAIQFDSRVRAVGGITLDPSGMKVEWAGGFFHEDGIVFDPYSSHSFSNSGYHGQLFCQRCVDVISPLNAIIRTDLLEEAIGEVGASSGLLALQEIFLKAALIVADRDQLTVVTPLVQQARNHAWPSFSPVDRSSSHKAQIRQRRSRWYGAHLSIEHPYGFKSAHAAPIEVRC